MSEVYLAADTNFFDVAAAKNIGIELEEYNQHLVENWNQTVKSDDIVLLLGDISSGSLLDTKYLFSKINGKKKIISYQEENSFSEEDWKTIGVASVCNIGGWIDGLIEEEKTKVIIATSKEFLLKLKNKKYCATAESLSQQKEIYKNKILNISIKNWNYCPLKYSILPQLIDNQILFNQMKDVETNLNE